MLGNAGVDISLAVPRLPRPGETLVGGAVRRAPGGKGLNQAVTAARMGVGVAFCAPLGDDADGAFVAARLRLEPFGALMLPHPGPCTDTSIILVAADGENCIVTAGACAAALGVAAARDFAGGARPGDVLLLQGNLSRAATEAAAWAGRARGARVILNTAPISWPMEDVIAACWGVVANAGEAEAITGRRGAAAAAGLAALGPTLAIVTLGGDGCVTGGGAHHAALRVDVVDSTGAGDAFCGALAAALARGVDEAAAIGLAQGAAAGTVTRAGAFEALPAGG